jgi:hypothetical protein
MHLGGPKRKQPFHLSGLIACVQVKMNAWRQLRDRAVQVEREVGPDSVPGAEKQEVVTPLIASHVVECRRPKVGLPPEIGDT